MLPTFMLLHELRTGEYLLSSKALCICPRVKGLVLTQVQGCSRHVVAMDVEIWVVGIARAPRALSTTTYLLG